MWRQGEEGKTEGGILGEMQAILERIDVLTLDNVDSDASVYHSTHSACVQFILCQVHASQL